MHRPMHVRSILLALAVVMIAAGTASAAVTSEASGTVVGNPGGAAVTWSLTMPLGTNVTLTLGHWPCQSGRAVYLEVYGPAGLMATSHEADACTQKAVFNTVGGGTGTIKLLNYLDGVAVSYTLKADGLVLPGPAPTGGSGTPPPATDGGVVTDTLAGNAGGAFKVYSMPVVAGHAYVLDLSYSMSGGGSSWPGVGINVWAPTGSQIGRSTATSPSSERVSFTPTANMTLSVQVFNYNPGQTMSFALLGLPGGLEN